MTVLVPALLLNLAALPRRKETVTVDTNQMPQPPPAGRGLLALPKKLRRIAKNCLTNPAGRVKVVSVGYAPAQIYKKSVVVVLDTPSSPSPVYRCILNKAATMFIPGNLRQTAR